MNNIDYDCNAEDSHDDTSEEDDDQHDTKDDSEDKVGPEKDVALDIATKNQIKIYLHKISAFLTLYYHLCLPKTGKVFLI